MKTITHCPKHPSIALIESSEHFTGRPESGYCQKCRSYYNWSTGEITLTRWQNFWNAFLDVFSST
jgi:hypothetical protein